MRAPQDEVFDPHGEERGNAARLEPRGPVVWAIMIRTDLQPSQLPRIRERKRRHPPGVFVEDQGAGDRWLGTLAAVFALAKPAVDADRRALGLFQIDPGGVDQARRMANFTTKPDGKTRLRLRVRRNRAAHHLRNTEISRAVGQLD